MEEEVVNSKMEEEEVVGSKMKEEVVDQIIKGSVIQKTVRICTIAPSFEFKDSIIWYIETVCLSNFFVFFAVIRRRIHFHNLSSEDNSIDVLSAMVLGTLRVFELSSKYFWR